MYEEWGVWSRTFIQSIGRIKGKGRRESKRDTTALRVWHGCQIKRICKLKFIRADIFLKRAAPFYVVYEMIRKITEMKDDNFLELFWTDLSLPNHYTTSRFELVKLLNRINGFGELLWDGISEHTSLGFTSFHIPLRGMILTGHQQSSILFLYLLLFVLIEFKLRLSIGRQIDMKGYFYCHLFDNNMMTFFNLSIFKMI